MLRNRLTTLLLLAATALLLAACTTPTDALLATQGFGHFNAKSVNLSLDSSSSGSSLMAFSTQAVELLPGVSADGVATGLGSDGYNVKILAFGDPLATCTNQGGNESPGQNPAASASGDDAIGGDPSNRKGKYEFDVTTGGIDPTTLETATICPNDNWTADVFWIDWNFVSIDLQFIEADGSFTTVETLNYECETTLPSGGDEGSISCSPLR